jgi:hypothetical protein
MSSDEYVIVAEFTNETSNEMRIFLEMSCEEVFLSPGHHVELLAKPMAGLLPITISYNVDGLQVFPNRAFDPDWHLRFKGQLIKPQYPTRLSDFDETTKKTESN